MTTELVGPTSVLQGMTKKRAHQEWPRWANWALLAVLATSVVTVAAAINDIW